MISMAEVFKVAGAILASVLLGSGIVAVIVRVLANWISKRTLDYYNNRHEKELEQLKASYSEALAKTNHELEKAQRRHFLYSQSQFELYYSLWKQLVYTKRLADDLWEKADPKNLPSFADQIRQTKFVIEENMLLIEEEHYIPLMDLMGEFENFKVGKQRLVEIRQSSTEEILANIEDVAEMIRKNGNCKEKYDNLVTQIGISFRKQLHG